jgi:hypothetical protein
MIELKLIEVRDAMTCISGVAIKLGPSTSEAERWLLARAGYGESPEGQAEYVLLGNLDGGHVLLECDPYFWPTGGGTMATVHEWITLHWGEFRSGDVVDVEFIRGKSKHPKVTDRLWRPK